jgi:hypothetical protein
MFFVASVATLLISKYSIQFKIHSRVLSSLIYLTICPILWYASLISLIMGSMFLSFYSKPGISNKILKGSDDGV